MLKWFLMGGRGRRFQEAGYGVPKPLLQFGNRRLINLAIESTAKLEGKLHYSIHRETVLHPALVNVLPEGCWHVVDGNTLGALQTILQAKCCLDTEEELLICDCDSMMDTNELANAVQTFRGSAATGGVTVRKTQDPNCSYASLDSQWWVEETREKDAFTPWSTTGPYWFRSAKAFLKAAQKASNAHLTSISPVYNYLEGRTLAVPIQSFQHLGTPQEYEEAINVSTAMKVVPSSLSPSNQPNA